ncbi:Gfo/Idh/MocA family oxidoreductase [Streptomyces coacervatus]|uniref:Gfo/Idh/MocA family oxidoreductase n=1 Tax=Streptomyces coacervatus TaxID=647381 RepID=A0ABP7HNI8_9ACTN|nr:Gfo/Idh/MocA family oxidoreductase [Streptomyces coacervatus]MDF2272047.1 Gfo/Idh/MocA family oxidoreductase [Streptomyces coacervatus]
MRVGIIGAGGIGRMHAKAVTAAEEADLAGVYDVDPDRAQTLARLVGTTAFASPEDLYAASTGVVVASPNRTHAEHARQAIAHGTSVLCEKPMAVSLTQAAEMRTRAMEANGVCAVGFNYRYLPVMRELRTRIESGELGRILHVNVAFKRTSALTRKQFTWRDGLQERFTSGALGDLGVHLIDLLYFLFSSPVDLPNCQVALQTKVATKGSRQVKVDDHTFVSGRLANGPSFTLTASKSSKPEEAGLTLSVTGGLGDFSYNSQDGPVFHLRTGVDWEQLKALGTSYLEDPSGEVAGWADTFLAQLHDWTAAVTTSAQMGTLADFEDGYRAQRVLEELLRTGGRL